MSYLSGTFTVKSGGVFRPQNSYKAHFRAVKNLIADFKVKTPQPINKKELISKTIVFPP
jgi:hypothetical protein